MPAYLIKLRVEGLFYHRRFVLGFLLNVWLEVPEAGDRDDIPVKTSQFAAERKP